MDGWIDGQQKPGRLIISHDIHKKKGASGHHQNAKKRTPCKGAWGCYTSKEKYESVSRHSCADKRGDSPDCPWKQKRHRHIYLYTCICI